MMHTIRILSIAAISAIALVPAGCAKQGQGTTTTASAAPASPVAPGSPSATGSPSAMPNGSPGAPAATAAATATPMPNLLDPKSGTIVRAYPAGVEDPYYAPDNGTLPEDTDKGPWVYVFELAGTTKLSGVTAALPAKDEKGQGSTVTFAVSSTGPDSGFSDIATLSSGTANDPQSAAVNVTGRWVRVTLKRSGAVRPAYSFGAYGQIVPPPAAMNVVGTYVQYDRPYDKSGTFRTAPDNNDPWFLRAVAFNGGGVNGEQCFDGHLGDSYPGTLSGRLWSWKTSEGQGTFIVNDDASMLVGSDGTYWIRSNKNPKYCVPQTVGKGSVNVLVLEPRSWPGLYPVTDEDSAKDAPRFRFSHIGASLLDRQLLSKASAVIFNGLCNAGDVISAEQGQMISQWVQNGHKLLIYDADMCGNPTQYAMLPYQFKSDNPGAQGAKGDRLIQVEDNTLGTADKSDKTHYFDPLVYAQNPNQLGDANTVTTQDPHWCGHLFGTNVHHVNGFMQMYANYGKGVIIYDGFDHDDGSVASYQRIRMLELDQPIPADLPCTQQASLAFLIEPNRSGKFVPGKAQTMTFPMELLANQGWKGHVNITASGDLKASVAPNSFDISGGTKPLKVAVSIPGNAKPGVYNVIVTGDGGNKQTSQATIQLTAAVPIVKQFQQKRIRLYGIHFDVDKATIKPQSEPVIAQIAAVMKQNPSWRFRVEGHTDSDGGYQHNMVLSQQRAQAVVNDLVNRYHIARSRLTAAGYGYSHPVAPNTTAAGKALNRRVELVRL